MSIAPRKVKNKKNPDGTKSGRAGTVYDVSLNYKLDNEVRSYGKRGFLTKAEAQSHESKMRDFLISPHFIPTTSVDEKKTVGEFLTEWLKTYGEQNLRPTTYIGYATNINKHLIPAIGSIPLKKLTPAMIDSMYVELRAKNLSERSVQYVHAVLRVALEGARKYRYIQTNPARDILTKFGKSGATPPPYTPQQVQQLFGQCLDSEWEGLIMLGAMYGLRRNEAFGLQTTKIDLDKRTFMIDKQLPHNIPTSQKIIEEFAPTKSHDRELPITDATYPYFEKLLLHNEQQKELAKIIGDPYYDNKLLLCRPDGSPWQAKNVSSGFPRKVERLGLPRIRFHDLRHTAATNMHQLTGDFFTVAHILGHTLKGIGKALDISPNLDSVTAQYVEVRLERKLEVLDTYHKALKLDECCKIHSKGKTDRDSR